MKKRMLLPLIFLLTFTLGLTSTPAAEEWVLHKTITHGSDVNDVAFSQTGKHLAAGVSYNSRTYALSIYDGNTFSFQFGKDFGDDAVNAVAFRKGWYEAAVGVNVQTLYLWNTKSNFRLFTASDPNRHLRSIRDLVY